MNKTLNISRLQELLTGGETQEVIDQLLQHANSINHRKTSQEIRHFATRWADYCREERMETVAREELRLSKRQFNKSLLQLLDDLEIGEGQVPDWMPNRWRSIMMAAATVAVILLAWQNFNSFTNNKKIGETEQPNQPPILPDTSVALAKETVPTEKPTVINPPSEEKIARTKTEKAKTSETREKSPKIPLNKTQNESTTVPANTNLSIQCKTNKDSKNPVFKTGETLRLYVQVNKACKIRTIYQLADQRLILLENDRIINKTDTNKWIELGDGFVIEAPFGAENFYLFAQNTDFPALVTETTSDGYTLIKEGLPDALSKSRGLKKKQYTAETKLNITTKN